LIYSEVGFLICHASTRILICNGEGPPNVMHRVFHLVLQPDPKRPDAQGTLNVLLD
jgi:hypothetical protein